MHDTSTVKLYLMSQQVLGGKKQDKSNKAKVNKAKAIEI